MISNLILMLSPAALMIGGLAFAAHPWKAQAENFDERTRAARAASPTLAERRNPA
jgi:nitrogen fixation-related uncharacterized protein